MRVSQKLNVIFDFIVDALAVFSAVLIIFLMLIISAEIFMRFFFNRPIPGVIEIAEYCLLYFTFLTAAWLLKVDKHITVDALPQMLKPGARNWLNLVTSVICALSSLALAWIGLRVVVEHFIIKLKLTTLFMPPSYLIIAVIPLAYILLFIQFSRRAHGLMDSLRKKSPSLDRTI